MKRIITFILVILISSITISINAQSDFTERILEVAPSVVQITVELEDGTTSIGTGFVTWYTGEIFTNEHVVNKDDIAQITISTFVDFFEAPIPSYIAEIEYISSDPEQFDFAILQVIADIDGNELRPEDINMTYIRRWNDDPNLGLTSQIIVLAYPQIGQGNLVISQGTLTSIMNREESSEMNADVVFGDGASGGMVLDGELKLIGIATEQKSEGIGQSVVGFISMQSICADDIVDCWEGNPKRRETLESPTCQLALARDYCEETVFGIGDTAQIGGLDTINHLRENPFLIAGILIDIPRGTFVEIVDGPQISTEDPSLRISELFWWKVRTADGIEGWMTEDYYGEPTLVYSRPEDPVLPAASCELETLYPITIRGGPSSSYDQVASRRYQETISADGQIEGQDGWTWWRLMEGFWVREDTVRESGTCFSLPIVEAPNLD